MNPSSWTVTINNCYEQIMVISYKTSDERTFVHWWQDHKATSLHCRKLNLVLRLGGGSNFKICCGTRSPGFQTSFPLEVFQEKNTGHLDFQAGDCLEQSTNFLSEQSDNAIAILLLKTLLLILNQSYIKKICPSVFPKLCFTQACTTWPNEQKAAHQLYCCMPCQVLNNTPGFFLGGGVAASSRKQK